MAGSRPSSFKKGGGFLNNVVGKIEDYEFTPDFPGGDGKNKSGKSDFNPLYFVLTAQVDGADKPQQTTLFAGSADDFEISEDGKTLTPVDDSVGIRSNTDLGRFIASLCEAGFDESRLPDDGEPINYEAILGERVEFVQVKDEDAMAKQAKNWRKSNGKYNDQGQKKGKDGKYYNLTYVTVANVLEREEEAPARGAKASKDGKAAKTAAGKSSKGPSVKDIAKDTLLAILADNDGSIAKSALPGKIALKLGAKHPQKEEVRKLIYSDDFLESEDGWDYDKGSKKQLISVKEE